MADRYDNNINKEVAELIIINLRPNNVTSLFPFHLKRGQPCVLSGFNSVSFFLKIVPLH